MKNRAQNQILAFLFLLISGPALASNGIDVQGTGNNDLPFSIQGTTVMDMTTSGLFMKQGGLTLGASTTTAGTGALTLSSTITAGGDISSSGNISGALLIATSANGTVSGIGADGVKTVYNLSHLTGCGTNYALTSNGSGSFSCVRVTDITNVGSVTLPTCTNQVLTFDGSSFSCVDLPKTQHAISCGSGQVLNGINADGSASCITPPQVTSVFDKLFSVVVSPLYSGTDSIKAVFEDFIKTYNVDQAGTDWLRGECESKVNNGDMSALASDQSCVIIMCRDISSGVNPVLTTVNNYCNATTVKSGTTPCNTAHPGQSLFQVACVNPKAQ